MAVGKMPFGGAMLTSCEICSLAASIQMHAIGTGKRA